MAYWLLFQKNYLPSFVESESLLFEPTQQSFVPIVWVNGTAEPINGGVFQSMVSGNEKLQNYISWHNQMRNKFPDREIIENPNAPPVLIQCNADGVKLGGLFDRLGGLRELIERAYQEKAVLLIKWNGEQNLENFLLPNLFNWTLPSVDTSRRSALPLDGLCGKILPVWWHQNKIIVTTKGGRGGGGLNATVEQEFNLSYSLAWHATFLPSNLVWQEINRASASLGGLIPGHYHAIHCRVRHPAHSKKRSHSIEDREGLNFTGDQKRSAIQTAIHAIQCSNWLTSSLEGNQLPTYFYADSEDLVHSIIRDKADDVLEGSLQNLSRHSRVAGRWNDFPIAHISDAMKRPIESYASTFVDLYIAASARCVTLGVGRFGYMSTVISGTKCRTIHERVPNIVARDWNMLWLFDEVGVCPAHVESAHDSSIFSN